MKRARPSRSYRWRLVRNHWRSHSYPLYPLAFTTLMLKFWRAEDSSNGRTLSFTSSGSSSRAKCPFSRAKALTYPRPHVRLLLSLTLAPISSGWGSSIRYIFMFRSRLVVTVQLRLPQIPSIWLAQGHWNFSERGRRQRTQMPKSKRECSERSRAGQICPRKRGPSPYPAAIK